MALERRFVIRNPSTPTPLPPWCSKFALLFQCLKASGLLQQLSQDCRLPRTSGYQMLDLLSFFLAYFSSGRNCGISEFCRETHKFGQHLAAIGERKRWPTQSSISGMLSDVTEELVQKLNALLLGIGSDDSQLELHASTGYRDTCGDTWHVFHWDPTVTPLRQRALPHGSDLPEPTRYGQRLAAPGYSGRKRGELQLSRATLQHSGSALWRECIVKSGNISVETALPVSMKTVNDWAQRHALSPQKCVVCIDGVGQGWSQVRIGTGSPVCFLTRLGRLDVLEEPQARQRMASEKWERVSDSCSGPVRYAMDIGELERGDDWKARLVVSRFKSQDGIKHGAGKVMDGWQYELYATDVPISAFGAPEVVTLYYGRNGLENRFHAEDCELGLDRVLSYCLEGQWLTQVVGLWVWNQSIILGAKCEQGLSCELPKQTPRAREEMKLPIHELPKQEEPVANEMTEAKGEGPGDSAEPVCAVLSTESPLPGDEQRSQEGSNPQQECKLSQESTVQWLNLPGRWPTGTALPSLEDRPGWSWSQMPQGSAPTCSQGTTLRFHGLRPLRSGKTVLRYRGTQGCASCPIRRRCFGSKALKFIKELSFALQTPLEEAKPSSDAPEALARPVESRMGAKSTDGQTQNVRLKPVPEVSPGALELCPPLMLPAVFRKRLNVLCGEAELTVELDLPPPPVPAPTWLAKDCAARQRRRKTWAERLAWNALPEAAEVTVTLAESDPKGRLRSLQSELPIAA